jgi:hypothetical protein
MENTMPSCQKCGAGNAPSTTSCTTCGTSIEVEQTDLSALWRIRFDLVEKAGGPQLPHIKRLRAGERLRLMWNFWALLFGPFYYIAKGMWRKALVISFSTVALTIFINKAAPSGDLDFFANNIGYAANALFTVFANIDYYRKVVLNHKGWW